jgi:hypothetical protein
MLESASADFVRLTRGNSHTDRVPDGSAEVAPVRTSLPDRYASITDAQDAFDVISIKIGAEV